MSTLRIGAHRCWKCGELFDGPARCPQDNGVRAYCEPTSGLAPITIEVPVVAPAREETPREFCEREGLAVPLPYRGNDDDDANARDGIARRQVGKLSRAILGATCERLSHAQMIDAMTSLATLDRLSEGVQRAVDIAHRHGGHDGQHHKQWVIDQMLRALLGDGYAAWRAAYDAETDGTGELIGGWDEGITP